MTPSRFKARPTCSRTELSAASLSTSSAFCEPNRNSSPPRITPGSGAPLASQSTISRLENAPSKTEAARLSAALLDQFGATVKPGKLETLDALRVAELRKLTADWSAFAPPLHYATPTASPIDSLDILKAM